MLPESEKSPFDFEAQNRDEIQKTVIQCVFMAHQVVAVCYNRISAGCPDDRKMVRDYVNQKQILNIETAIDGQISIATDQAQSPAERKLALSRVQEGMNYWKNLILKRIEAVA